MPFRAKLKQAIPACPAVLFLSGYGSFLCYYAHFLYILFPSFRILTAAFTSRSIRFPHSHRYIRSDNASSFFLCPHALHILLDAKYLSTLVEIIYVFLTIFLYLLKCPQSLILSALRAFCFCGKPHISRSIFLYFRYQAWLKSW